MASTSTNKNLPTYDLDEIKRLLSYPLRRIITRTSRREAASLGYASDDEMITRVHQLMPEEFYKTMECESEEFKGLWQDVYKTYEPGGIRLYIKLQKSEDGDGVLVNFKRDKGVY